MAGEQTAGRLLGEWRQNVMESLKSVHHKLDVFDERLRIIEVGVVQKIQIEKLEVRVGLLEGFKQRILGYASAIGLVAGAAFELVRTLWKH